MSDAENTTREKLIRHIFAAIDQSACYDDDGEMKLSRHIDVQPYEVPDLTDGGAAAFIADALIAAFPTLTSAAGTDEGYRRDVKYAIASELEDELTEHGRFDLNDLDDNKAYWALMERVTSAVVSAVTETHEGTEPEGRAIALLRDALDSAWMLNIPPTHTPERERLNEFLREARAVVPGGKQ